MKRIFQKSDFPKSPGGNLYEWKAVETIFAVQKNGLYVIRIKVSAKDKMQNKSKDDDDLMVALDGFDFGKYEQYQEQPSWKGFGASAGWNGAVLKGGTKIIYYFINLNKGRHVLKFFADETPVLKNIEVYAIADYTFELSGLRPPEKIKSELKGIPWLSFVFVGVPGNSIVLGVSARSSKHKGGTDGDNLKVVVNGRILQNILAPTSDKYKNFYFSGDLNEFDVLTISEELLSKPLAFENAVELWYDEEPEIASLKINFFNEEEFFEKYELKGLRELIYNEIVAIVLWFKMNGAEFSSEFLQHSLAENPGPLIYKSGGPIAQKVKADPVYKKILQKIEEKIVSGNLDGEIWPADFNKDPEMNGGINFNSPDLSTALHGVKKIEYSARKTRSNSFAINLVLLDIYDFEKQMLSLPPFNLFRIKELIAKYIKQKTINQLDLWEELGIINNYEIQIHLIEILNSD